METYFRMIPITVATESKDFEITLPKLWMYLQKTIRIGQFQSKKWIILNVQSTGYYRVNYDPKNWRLIVKQLLENHEEIHYLNRAQLIDDVFHLAQANKVGYRLAFDLTEYCTNETEYIPWRSLFNNFDFIDMMLRAESNYSVFKVNFTQHSSCVSSFQYCIPQNGDKRVFFSYRSLLLTKTSKYSAKSIHGKGKVVD